MIEERREQPEGGHTLDGVACLAAEKSVELEAVRQHEGVICVAQPHSTA